MKENINQTNDSLFTNYFEEKKEITNEQIIREIQIDSKIVSKQIKLNILGIDIFFPYKPYENRKL